MTDRRKTKKTHEWISIYECVYDESVYSSRFPSTLRNKSLLVALKKDVSQWRPAMGVWHKTDCVPAHSKVSGPIGMVTARGPFIFYAEVLKVCEPMRTGNRSVVPSAMSPAHAGVRRHHSVRFLFKETDGNLLEMFRLDSGKKCSPCGEAIHFFRDWLKSFANKLKAQRRQENRGENEENTSQTVVKFQISRRKL